MAVALDRHVDIFVNRRADDCAAVLPVEVWKVSATARKAQPLWSDGRNRSDASSASVRDDGRTSERDASRASKRIQRSAQDLNGVIDAFLRDFQAGHGPRSLWAECTDPHVVFPQGVTELLGGRNSRVDIEKDDIGLHGGEIDRETGHVGDGLGESSGVRMVVGEPLDMMIERVKCSGRDDTHLAHAAAEHFAKTVDAANG